MTARHRHGEQREHMITGSGLISKSRFERGEVVRLDALLS